MTDSDGSTDTGSKGLSGKTALVTGGTRGLGNVIAEWLVRDGANLVISGRREDDVDSAVTNLRSPKRTVVGIASDLSQVPDAHQLAESAIDALGGIDILVNNAGMSIRSDFWEVTDEEWDDQVNVNLRSPFIIAQHVARHMIESSKPGRIVNVGTIGARKCHRDALVYDSAKGAVEVMTRNMAYELAPYGISVNCVVPGAIPHRPGNQFDGAENEDYLKHIPMGRFGHADDIAAAVRFFCLPESAFTTGQSLLVDGAHASYLPEF